MLFAIGCILLKEKRSDLKRDVYATKFHLIAGMSLVMWGLLGNILLSPTVLEFFVSTAWLASVDRSRCARAVLLLLLLLMMMMLCRICDSVYLQVLYFGCVLLVVTLMFQRARVLRVLMKLTPKGFAWLRNVISRNMVDVKNDTLVFFCKRYTLRSVPFLHCSTGAN